MDPAFRFDRIQEDGMKEGNLLFPWFDRQSECARFLKVSMILAISMLFGHRTLQV